MKVIQIFGVHACRGIFWFRIFGVGLHFKNLRKRNLVFSERIGKTKRLRIGRISVKWLKLFKY